MAKGNASRQFHTKRFLFGLPALLFGVSFAAQAADEREKGVSFKADVAPILVKKCLGCHNDQKAKGGLNMKTFDLLKKGGKGNGAEILVAGDPGASGLIEAVGPDAEPRMPYKLPPLSEKEIGVLTRWVRERAKFDGGSESETKLASLVDPLKDLPKVAVKVPASDAIAAVAFSPDGKTLAAALGRDVVLFDPSSGKPVATLAGHPGQVTSVLITPDGKTLVAAGGRPGMFGAVTIWDLTSKARRQESRGHDDSILSAALSPDGKTLATASYDRLVKLWDVASGKETRTLKEHTDAVHAVAFSRDGASLASAGADRTVKVWDVATGKKRVTMSDATAEVYAVAFAPDGKTVLAGGVDRSIRAWEVKGDTATLLRTEFAHDGAVLRLVVAPDGSTLISSGEDKAVKLWDLATLKPRATLATQSDWPMGLAISPDGTRVAVGRYDGSLALLDAKTGKVATALREAPSASPPKPKLAANPSLNPPNPRGAVRGTTVKVSLTGDGVGEADLVVFPEPGIEAKILPREKPEPGKLDVELTIAPDARPGPRAFSVRTPRGMTGPRTFAVAAAPEASEVEPNDEPARAKIVALPATLIGTIEKEGDVDHFRFEAKAGQHLVFETLARPMGSSLDGTLALLDDEGRVLAEARDSDEGLDPTLTFVVPRDGTYSLRMTDAEFGGSGNHIYRILAGAISRIDSAFPLGVEAGHPYSVHVSGANLERGVIENTPVATRHAPGTIIEVTDFLGRKLALNSRRIVVAEGLQSTEAEPNDDAGHATAMEVPGGVSGRIGKAGDGDHYRFVAKKGQRLIVEVYGRRLGTPIDPAIEILDEKGRPVPRAVLRPVEETAVAFRDHPSGGRNIRLTQWNDFAEGDYVLIGRELMRLFELPRNLDDDAVFWGLGNARNNSGERVAFLETTPEHHPLAQPIYKVEIHPPGTTFPSGGVPPVTLYYRNDDGGPGLGKDSKLTFDPPADGTFIVRVEDARGLGGERYGYHLIARRPKPDFTLSISSENPNVPRGGTTVLTASITRSDGFEGPVDVSVEGLPPGVTATSVRIEPEVFAADLILMADASAPAFSEPTWSLVARGRVDDSPGSEIVHRLDPGGPRSGYVTVTGEPNLKIGFRPDRVAIRPGERVRMTFTVERSPAFKGRVPIDVRNLPRGVKVSDIGLNGVLVTETQSEREVFIVAEPWARPGERLFYAVGKCEPVNTDHSSMPIRLTVLPARPEPKATASAGSR